MSTYNFAILSIMSSNHLNPNANEWTPSSSVVVWEISRETSSRKRPDDNKIIRNTYIEIINSYRLRLEVEYKQMGHSPEQSIYNCKDVDKAFENVDDQYIQYYAKDFRGYVRHGIYNDSFPYWISVEDDLIPIVYMAINDDIHNITKRVYIGDEKNEENDNGAQSARTSLQDVYGDDEYPKPSRLKATINSLKSNPLKKKSPSPYQYYCIGKEGEKVEHKTTNPPLSSM